MKLNTGIFVIAFFLTFTGFVNAQEKTSAVGEPAKSLSDLNSILPNNVQKILENAEVFEVWSLILDGTEKRISLDIGRFDFSANKIAKLEDKELRKQLIENFYFDVTTKSRSAGCWTPHHAIKATYKGETVAIGICFHCGNFSGKIDETKFSNVIAMTDESKSLRLFDEIIEKYGVDVK